MVKKLSTKPKEVFNLLIIFALIWLAACLTLNPKRYAQASFEGLCLWAESVVPSLLPFSVICLLICSLGGIEKLAKPFKHPCKRLKIFPLLPPLYLLCALCGYPTACKLLCQQQKEGKISQAQLEKYAPICSACSPAFAISTVGFKAFGGVYYGVKLLIAVHCAIIISAIIFNKKDKNSAPTEKIVTRQNNKNLLYDSFYGAQVAVLCAGVFICFFYTLSRVIEDFNLLLPFAKILQPLLGEASRGLLIGLIEGTSGCFAAAKSGGFFALPIAAFLLTFGGSSILLQQLCQLYACNASAKSFVKIKLIQGVIAFLLICITQLIFGV